MEEMIKLPSWEKGAVMCWEKFNGAKTLKYSTSTPEGLHPTLVSVCVCVCCCF